MTNRASNKYPECDDCAFQPSYYAEVCKECYDGDQYEPNEWDGDDEDDFSDEECRRVINIKVIA